MSRINCPVYGFYGGDDARINTTIPKTKELMAGAGKTYEPIIYDGAGHGFMRAGASEANRKGRAAAWERWKSILEKL
jgi:carboxymethylenebutenolidase